MADRVPVSWQDLQDAKTSGGGYSRKSVARWGVPFPLPKGWQKTLLKYGAPYDDRLNHWNGGTVKPKRGPACSWITRKGDPCPWPGDRIFNGQPVCHIHDPNGRAQQHRGQVQVPQAVRTDPWARHLSDPPAPVEVASVCVCDSHPGTCRLHSSREQATHGSREQAITEFSVLHRPDQPVRKVYSRTTWLGDGPPDPNDPPPWDGPPRRNFSSEQLRIKAREYIDGLKIKAREYIDGHPAPPLGDLVNFLTRSEALPYVSAALADMLTSGELELTDTRHVLVRLAIPELELTDT